MTNNLKAERTLTAEELQAIIDGCEGVTRGPWGADQQIYDREVGGEHEQSVGELIVYTENPETDDDPTHICEVLGFVPREDMPSWAMYSDHVPSDVARANAVHIARLDPETVTAMALELQHLRSQSLSTQQPMGEVTEEMVERAARHLATVAGVDEDEPLYFNSEQIAWMAWVDEARSVLQAALHPNQESGE